MKNRIVISSVAALLALSACSRDRTLPGGAQFKENRDLGSDEIVFPDITLHQANESTHHFGNADTSHYRFVMSCRSADDSQHITESKINVRATVIDTGSGEVVVDAGGILEPWIDPKDSRHWFWIRDTPFVELKHDKTYVLKICVSPSASNKDSLSEVQATPSFVGLSYYPLF